MAQSPLIDTTQPVDSEEEGRSSCNYGQTIAQKNYPLRHHATRLNKAMEKSVGG